MPLRSPFEFIRQRAPILCVLIVACGLLAACGVGQESRPATAVPTETMVPTATALSGIPRIGPVIWSNSIDPGTNEPIDLATPTVDGRVIYAVVPIEALPAGSQLLARWYFNDTSLDALDSALRVDHDRVSGWLEFHIERTGTEPWPDGVYEVVISDGTTELQRSEVSIS